MAALSASNKLSGISFCDEERLESEKPLRPLFPPPCALAKDMAVIRNINMQNQYLMACKDKIKRHFSERNRIL